MTIETDIEDVKCCGEELETMERDINDVKNFIDDLGNQESHNVGVQCDPFGDNFEKKYFLNDHHQKEHANKLKVIQKYKMKERELENKICVQKHKLTTDYRQKKEVFDNFQCKCRGFCRIFHNKHNWKKCICKEIVKRM